MPVNRNSDQVPLNFSQAEKVVCKAPVGRPKESFQRKVSVSPTIFLEFVIAFKSLDFELRHGRFIPQSLYFKTLAF